MIDIRSVFERFSRYLEISNRSRNPKEIKKQLREGPYSASIITSITILQRALNCYTEKSTQRLLCCRPRAPPYVVVGDSKLYYSASGGGAGESSMQAADRPVRLILGRELPIFPCIHKLPPGQRNLFMYYNPLNLNIKVVLQENY